MTINKIYEIFSRHPHISTDSRHIPKDSIFFALKGENFDGNKFADSALKEGALYVVVDDAGVVKDKRYILVPNSLETLQQLARFHRKQLGLKILAITGTNGKTTTKELTTIVLSKKYKVTSTKGNLNNHIGVPLTLLSFNNKTEFGIVEMGANHPGEISSLCEIALPDYGLVTNVGKAHLEGFGSFEGVKKTKAELYRFIEHNNGKVFINNDNPELIEMSEGCEKIFYSTSGKRTGTKGSCLQGAPCMYFKAKFSKGWLYIKSNLAGGYNFENALAATCIGNYFNINPLDIKDAIESYTPKNNRSQFKQTKNNKLLLDAYNANPSSMKAALNNFQQITGKQKAVILGDMLELGVVANEEHQKIIDLLSSVNPDKVYLVGEIFSSCKYPESFAVFSNTESLKEELNRKAPIGYYILIKGSRSIKLETVIDLL
jgi:UDP-N-acetylmuramoyl-tripeptide--D-alanyl-D-alanine ligase